MTHVFLPRPPAPDGVPESSTDGTPLTVSAAADDAYLSFRKRPHFASLDGLRAIAVIWVVWVHSMRSRKWDVPLLDLGYHGVDLFFVISGFLITTLLLREEERNGSISFKAFFARRSLRIFPLYYAVLLIHVPLVLLFKGDSARGEAFFSNLVYHLTYTSNFASMDPFALAWSLACEEQFYLVWPWLMILLPRRLAFGIILAYVIGRTGLYYLHDLGHLTHLGINPFKAPVIRPHLTPIGIPMGILLAFAFHHEASHRRLRTVLGWKGASLVALALLVGVLHLQKHDEWWGMLPLAMALLVGACVLREDHRLAPILGSRPLVFVGKISYGMYLFHMLLISLVCRVAGSSVPPDSVRLFLVALPLTIAAAAISYRYFETPFLKVKDRFKR